MNKLRKYLFLCACLVLTTAVIAQQEVMISQYMSNGLYVNPAYAGSHKYIDVSALYRTQWTGLEGAPTSQYIGVDAPLADETMGVALTLINDKIGDSRQTEVAANWSYHLLLNESGTTKLSFGLKAGFSAFNANLTQTKVFDSGDPIFNNNINNEFVPKFGVGTYIYNPKWYAGFAIPTIFAADNNLDYDINGGDSRYFERHYYLTGGYVFKANENLKIKPSLFLRYQAQAPVQVDINCNILLNNAFWIGASYRTNDALVAILEYNFDNVLRIGYSYDFTITEIATYSNGSHEVSLGYRFGKDPVKTKTPRYF